MSYRSTEWQEQAICGQADPELFYPDQGVDNRQAKAMCLRCDVREECLTDALEHRDFWGVRGGFSERELKQIAAGVELAVSKPCPGCGREMPARTHARYCTQQCANRERERRRRERAA